MKLALVSLAVLIAGWSQLCGAQTFPAKPIRMVVGYAAGGPVDAAARIVAPIMQRNLGQPVLVDNRGGASGTLGADHVAKSAADGYTLFFAASATRTINPFVQKSMPFDPLRDYTPISLVVNASNALAVGADAPFKTLADLIEFAKANPGRVTFGSAGIGASNHLAGALLAKMTGTDMVHVPYKGNAPAMTDVMGGKITFMFDAIATAAAADRGGRARVIMQAASTRNRALPNVPTAAESGLPEFAVPNWYGLDGPPGLSAPIVQRLNAALHEALADAEVARRLLDAGYELAPTTPEQYGARVRASHDYWARATAGMKME